MFCFAALGFGPTVKGCENWGEMEIRSSHYFVLLPLSGVLGLHCVTTAAYS